MRIKIKTQNRNKRRKFYSRFHLEWGRSAAQSMEIVPCPSDVEVEEVRQTHLVDPEK